MLHEMLYRSRAGHLSSGQQVCRLLNPAQQLNYLFWLGHNVPYFPGTFYPTVSATDARTRSGTFHDEFRSTF
jgi:hypothetical protein